MGEISADSFSTIAECIVVAFFALALTRIEFTLCLYLIMALEYSSHYSVTSCSMKYSPFIIQPSLRGRIGRSDATLSIQFSPRSQIDDNPTATMQVRL